MAKKKRKFEEAPTSSPELRLLAEVARRQKANDAFSNPMARTGSNTPNLLEATEYPLQRMTFNYMLLQSLYRSHWIVRRIIDTVPEDMCKNWVTIVTEATPEEIGKVETCFKKTQIMSKFIEAMKWGRLFGGAGALIMIDGHEGMLDQPLNLEHIMPDSFCGLMVLDRWSGLSPTGDLVTDHRDPEYGLPKYYNITTQTQETFKVHHSRLLRFIGRDVPRWEKQAEMYWGVSEVEHVFEELRKRDNISWNVVMLTFRANLLALKMSDLGQTLTSTAPQAQQQIYNTLSAQNEIMSNQGMLLLDKEDDMEQKQYSFSGIADVQENVMLDVAGAAEIPATKLFGRAPAGMNATGDSDMQIYYDSISQKQNFHMETPLRKLLPVVWVSVHGYIPDDLDFKFNPIDSVSNKDRADLSNSLSEVVGKQYDRGLISQKMALKELKQQAPITGVFTNITDEDIEKAEDEVKDPMAGMESMPSMGDIPGEVGQEEQQQPVEDKDPLAIPKQPPTLMEKFEKWMKERRI